MRAWRTTCTAIGTRRAACDRAEVVKWSRLFEPFQWMFDGFRWIMLSRWILSLRLAEFDHLLQCYRHADMLARNGHASLKSVPRESTSLLS